MISALVGHLVGDYLLQNDWLAAGKKRSSAVCAVHCLIWSLAVQLLAGWPAWTLAVLFPTHFLQDRTSLIRRWMLLIGQRAFLEGPCAPWSIIVVDNVWHILTIWTLWRVAGLP